MTVTRNDPGLCGRCLHMREVVTARDATFFLCRRAQTDPTYPRYPRVPVRQCAGFDPVEPDRQPDA